MKKITKLGMAAAVLFCVVGLGSHTQAAMAAEETTIENGISIGNVNVGGMTENQAISAVEEYVDGLMDTTFTLKGETGSIQMTAEDMGVTADADTAVQEALAVGHAGSLINRYKTLQDLKKKKQLTDKELDGLIQYFKERKENMAKKYGEEKITMEGQSYYYIASELLP